MTDTPDDTLHRAALMREAGDLIGSEALARALAVSSRSIYYWMDGKRPVGDGVLREVRDILIRRRQHIGALVQRVRDEVPAS